MNRRKFLTNALSSLPLLALPSLPALAQSSPRQITIGQSADLSGSMQNIGRDVFTGAKLVFDQANAEGGSPFGHIRLLQLDDAGDPGRAIANVKRLIEEEHADVLFGLTSDSCIEAVTRSPAFTQSDINLFAPITGIDHRSGKARTVYLRPSYVEEMTRIIKQLTDLSLSRLALIYSPTPSMLAARDAILAGLKGQQIADSILPLPLQTGASNVNAIIGKMQQSQTQAAIFMGDSIFTALAIQKIRPQMPVLFMCLSSMVDSQLVTQLLGNRMAVGLMVSRVVPDPSNGVVPIVQKFIRTQHKYLDETLSAAGLEGFIAAQTLLSVLRRADSSHSLVWAAQHRVGKLDLGGWKIDLAATRATTRVEIAMVGENGHMI